MSMRLPFTFARNLPKSPPTAALEKRLRTRPILRHYERQPADFLHAGKVESLRGVLRDELRGDRVQARVRVDVAAIGNKDAGGVWKPGRHFIGKALRSHRIEPSGDQEGGCGGVDRIAEALWTT